MPQVEVKFPRRLLVAIDVLADGFVAELSHACFAEHRTDRLRTPLLGAELDCHRLQEFRRNAFA